MADDFCRQEALAYLGASSAHFGEKTGLLPPFWELITQLFAVFMAALLVFRFELHAQTMVTIGP